jgi:integrase/recombinase XerD
MDRAIAGRMRGPILLNGRGARMDRHAATRRLWHLAKQAGVQTAKAHPHMLRHTYVTTMLDAGVDLKEVQIALGPPIPGPPCGMTGPRKNLDRHPNYILVA